MIDMEKQKNSNIEGFVRIITQLSPASLQLMQNNAEVLLARDKIEQENLSMEKILVKHVEGGE